MESSSKGIYTYYCNEKNLPESLMIDNTIIEEVLLLRLLAGTLYISKKDDDLNKIHQSTNFLILPNFIQEDKSFFINSSLISLEFELNKILERIQGNEDGKVLIDDMKHLKKDLENNLNSDLTLPKNTLEALHRVLCVEENIKIDDFGVECDKYFKNTRENTSLYKSILWEMTSYFMKQHVAPATAFTHLYRCVELISFNFPLIFASKSKNYIGTYKTLQKFFKDEKGGEFQFFKTFLKTLFQDEEFFKTYNFKVQIFTEDSVVAMRRDIKKILQGSIFNLKEDGDYVEFEVEFMKMTDLIVTIRNRFFHMSHATHGSNFEPIDYSIEDIFISINSATIYWISSVILGVFKYSFSYFR